MDKQIQITFRPTGRVVYVLAGSSLLEASGRVALPLKVPCGGSGTCGKCRVQFLAGAPEATDACRAALGADEITSGWRLGCQVTLHAPATVEIPPQSLFGEEMQIHTDEGDPQRTAVAGDLPVTVADGETAFAAAFDIGTTTVAATLAELPGGQRRAIANCMNPQVRFGDDVISRIGLASNSPDDAKQLQTSIIQAVNDLLGDMCESAGADREQLRTITFAGNTTMQHLLCGLDVSNLAHLPFEPATFDAQDLSASELGIDTPNARVYVMPVIGGFLGGDTVAGMLATDIEESEKPVLMIDIGTNGEIILSSGGKLWAASTAAGPAFEGARIAQGMRATAGAIEKVVFDDDASVSVIGDIPATGLCGSALVDIAAELLRHGLLESTGRLLGPDELPADLSEALRKRVSLDGSGQARFLLAESPTAPVYLLQRDLRELQLAAGAIRAGVTILLQTAGLDAADLDRVWIAGGFGSFIRRSNAQRIGLIPEGVEHWRIRYVGNVSLQGARWVMLSSAARKEAETLAQQTEHVELSADLNFQMTFAEAMIFPE